MKYPILALLFICIPIALIAQPSQGSKDNIVNYEAKGNLEITHPLECVGFSELHNKLTPADLYNGLSKCMEKEDYEKAYQMFVLAGVYSTYDKLRVADKSAHQAHMVLTMQAMQAGKQESIAQFKEKLSSELSKGTPALKKNCETVRKIGKPDYYPSYMIQHGIGAFDKTKTKKDLVDSFDPDNAWTKALDAYLHCP